MRAPPSNPSRQLAERIVALELDGRVPGDDDATRAAITNVFSRLTAVVSSLVGARGCGAVLARAVHLCAATHPWLTLPAGVPVDAVAIGVAVCARLEQDGAAATVKAGAELLAHALDLLAAFIGKDLTFRLVRREWADLSGETA